MPDILYFSHHFIGIPWNWKKYIFINRHKLDLDNGDYEWDYEIIVFFYIYK